MITKVSDTGKDRVNFLGDDKFIYASMLAKDGGTVENKGIISTEGDGNYTFTSMVADGNSSKAINNGEISFDRSRSIGMLAENGGDAINNYRITQNHMTGYSTNGNIAMIAMPGGKITNSESGVIDLTNSTSNSNIGMYAFGRSSIALNDGTIALDGGSNIGMEASEGGQATNGIKGTIDLIGTGSNIGMSASGKRSKVENDGIIEVKGSHAIGMVASEGGYAINDGIIDLRNANHSTGMKADGKGSIIENRGNILLGEKADKKLIDSDLEKVYDTNDNIALKAINDGKIINSGKITFK